MRGQLMLILLILVAFPYAEPAMIDNDANVFVVGMAALRTLDEYGFKSRDIITGSAFVFQTETKKLESEEAGRYGVESPAAEIRCRVVITARPVDKTRSSFGLEIKLEKQLDDGSWAEVKSNGTLEKELIESIQHFIERYRKAGSLN